MTNRPKASQLLNLLTKAELEELKNKLVSGKKLRLLILTENLIKFREVSFGEKEKQQLYEQVFGENYTSKKDYLIRNEFRLLSQQIERLLVQKAIREEVEKNASSFHYYLLKSLQERKALKLFQKEYNGTYEKALEHQDYYAAHNITGLNFVNFTQFLNIKEKDFSYIEQLNKLKLQHLSCFYLTAFRQHQIDQQYLQNTLFPFSTEISPLKKKVTVNFEPFETDYSDYLYLKAKSYVEVPEVRVHTLVTCLQLAEQYFVKNEGLFEREVKFCLSALAKTHVLLNQFEPANQYFKLFFKKCTATNDVERLAVVVDYLTNLINLNQIEQAMLILKENAPHMEAVPRLRLWHQCLQIACLAFLEQIDELRELIPQSFADYGIPTKYYFRFYISIVSHLENRPEAAYREMENLRHLTANKKEERNIHPIVKFFHRFYYNIRVHPQKEDKQRLLNEKHLAEDMVTFSKSAIPEMRSYLPFLWLQRKLKVSTRPY